MLRHSETCNSIYPVTFPNIHRKSHFPKKKHCRSSSIADKRQRNACIGDCIGHHCNIQNNLKSQMPHNPATDKSSGQIFLHAWQPHPAATEALQTENQKDSSGCSHFLTYNRKNHIILRFRNKSKFLQDCFQILCRIFRRCRWHTVPGSSEILFHISPDFSRLQDVPDDNSLQQEKQL